MTPAAYGGRSAPNHIGAGERDETPAAPSPVAAKMIHVVAPPAPSGQLRASRWPLINETREGKLMNQIIWIVGLVVIVLFVLGVLGLR